jgi:hypothetical protein
MRSSCLSPNQVAFAALIALGRMNSFTIARDLVYEWRSAIITATRIALLQPPNLNKPLHILPSRRTIWWRLKKRPFVCGPMPDSRGLDDGFPVRSGEEIAGVSRDNCLLLTDYI